MHHAPFPSITYTAPLNTAIMNLSSIAILLATSLASTNAFAPSTHGIARPTATATATHLQMSADFGDDFLQDTPDIAQERIKDLIDEHSVVLFMKGSKIFPQCGFSNTATQILQSFKIEFHTVDVLADESIRSGIKTFSDWPTIPQLYVAGEFIGGSDIMIEMYQSGELGEMIEKSRADMM